MKINVMPKEDEQRFYAKVEQPNREIYVDGGSLKMSPRLLSRSFGIYDSKLDKLQAIYNRTNKKRIKKKLFNRMIDMILDETKEDV